MNGIHLVVFCAVDYQHFLHDCIESAKDNIQDNILSITVVSNAQIQTEYKLLLDKDVWAKIDPDFEFKGNLYKHNWVKQQIIKLHLDYFFAGNILVCDVEVRFKQKLKWCTEDKCKVYSMDRPGGDDSEVFVYELLGICPNRGYLSEASIFASDLLCDLRRDIENKFKNTFLQTICNLVFDDFRASSPELTVFMSEYELYNNYLINFRKDRLWSVVPYNKSIYSSLEHNLQTKLSTSDTQWINFYEQVKDPLWPACDTYDDLKNLPQYIQHELLQLYGPDMHLTYQTKFVDANSLWLDFYTQIKDPTWPDCNKEEDFVKLPKHIQQECIEVYGYQPSRS